LNEIEDLASVWFKSSICYLLPWYNVGYARDENKNRKEAREKAGFRDVPSSKRSKKELKEISRR
jgi:hypothetical protein